MDVLVLGILIAYALRTLWRFARLFRDEVQEQKEKLQELKDAYAEVVERLRAVQMAAVGQQVSAINRSKLTELKQRLEAVHIPSHERKVMVGFKLKYILLLRSKLDEVVTTMQLEEKLMRRFRASQRHRSSVEVLS